MWHILCKKICEILGFGNLEGIFAVVSCGYVKLAVDNEISGKLLLETLVGTVLKAHFLDGLENIHHFRGRCGYFSTFCGRSHCTNLQLLVKEHIGIADYIEGEVGVGLGSDAFGSGLQYYYKTVAASGYSIIAFRILYHVILTERATVIAQENNCGFAVLAYKFGNSGGPLLYGVDSEVFKLCSNFYFDTILLLYGMY